MHSIWTSSTHEPLEMSERSTFIATSTLAETSIMAAKFENQSHKRDTAGTAAPVKNVQYEDTPSHAYSGNET